METKRGRQRRYDLSPLQGFRCLDVAWAASALDELRERVYDQVAHLPQEALDYAAAATGLSIGRLMLHLGWAELAWMRRLKRGEAGPQDLEEALAAGALERFAEQPPSAAPAAELVSLCRRVRDEVTVPWLQSAADIDEKRLDDGSTVRGVLMHLCWHWVYHSGHIGLLAFECGYDYEWTVKRPLAPR